MSKTNQEIIEESLNFIFTHQEEGGDYCDTGDDMEMYCRSECSDYARARAKRMLKRILELKEQQHKQEIKIWCDCGDLMEPDGREDVWGDALYCLGCDKTVWIQLNKLKDGDLP